MNAMLTVWWKEVKENLRDKRTVMSALIYAPLFGPIMFVVLMNVQINHELSKAEGPLKVPVVGAQYAPNLVNALKHGHRMAGDVFRDALKVPRRAMKQFQGAGDPLQELRSAPLRALIGGPGHPANLRHGREAIVQLGRIPVGFPGIAPRPIDAETPFAWGVGPIRMEMVIGSG